MMGAHLGLELSQIETMLKMEVDPWQSRWRVYDVGITSDPSPDRMGR